MAGKANRKNGLNRCPYCGATDLDLNVKSGKLRCNYCRAMLIVYGVILVIYILFFLIFGLAIGGAATYYY